MLTKSLLIIIIIILTVVLVRHHHHGDKTTRVWDCVDRDTGDLTTVKMAARHGAGCGCPLCRNPEAQSRAEQTEYFSGCSDDASMKQALDCMCEGDDMAYAVNSFGAPGLEYKDWVMTQAVDPAVIKNHAEFIKDRASDSSQNITGRTYSPDAHDSYDPIPWEGLRRPQAVAMCNPTQVPDVDINLYSKDPTFTWKSAQ